MNTILTNVSSLFPPREISPQVLGSTIAQHRSELVKASDGIKLEEMISLQLSAYRLHLQVEFATKVVDTGAAVLNRFER